LVTKHRLPDQTVDNSRNTVDKGIELGKTCQIMPNINLETYPIYRGYFGLAPIGERTAFGIKIPGYVSNNTPKALGDKILISLPYI
jgi:hypothetical protein